MAASVSHQQPAQPRSAALNRRVLPRQHIESLCRPHHSDRERRLIGEVEEGLRGEFTRSVFYRPVGFYRHFFPKGPPYIRSTTVPDRWLRLRAIYAGPPDEVQGTRCEEVKITVMAPGER
jgi:hypothetical protein